MTEKELHIAKCWLNDAIEYGEEEHNRPFELAIEMLDFAYQFNNSNIIKDLEKLQRERHEILQELNMLNNDIHELANNTTRTIESIQKETTAELIKKLKEKLDIILDEPAYQHTGEDYFSGICSAMSIVDEVGDQYIKDIDGSDKDEIEF